MALRVPSGANSVLGSPAKKLMTLSPSVSPSKLREAPSPGSHGKRLSFAAKAHGAQTVGNCLMLPQSKLKRLPSGHSPRNSSARSKPPVSGISKRPSMDMSEECKVPVVIESPKKEAPEPQLSNDPKVRKYGRPPIAPIFVRQAQNKEPDILLKDIEEFLFGNARPMDFSQSEINISDCLLNGVLRKGTQEFEMFRHNLKRIKQENKSQGFVQLDKPPEHIEKQTVNLAANTEREDAREAKAKILKPPPNYLIKSTLSTLKKQSKRNLEKYVTQIEDNCKFVVKNNDPSFRTKLEEGQSSLQGAMSSQIDQIDVIHKSFSNFQKSYACIQSQQKKLSQEISIAFTEACSPTRRPKQKLAVRKSTHLLLDES